MADYLSLKDHVYKYISDRINSGSIHSGDKVNELQVCQELNISRTPVREALVQLASDGYLDFLPRRGFRVKSLDITRVQDLYEVIGTLDGRAAALCLSAIREEELAHMERLIAQMEDAIEAKQGERYYELQLAFHNVYLDRCTNTELVRLPQQLKNIFIRKYYLFENPNHEWMVLHETNQEHREILRLFRTRKADDLERYIRDVHWNRKNAKFDTFPSNT